MTRDELKQIIFANISSKDMLAKISEDRQGQVINEVYSFELDKRFDWINVKVDMQNELLGTTIKHCRATLPYPLKNYIKTLEILEKDNSTFSYQQLNEKENPDNLSYMPFILKSREPNG